MLTEFLRSVATFIDGFPPVVQFLALFVLAAIPLVESEVAAALGVILGVPVPLAIIAAAAGTSLMTIALTALGVKASEKLSSGKRGKKALGRVERFGIPLAMLLGSITFSNPLTALILTTAGLNRKAVATWGVVWAMVIAIVFALLFWAAVSLVYEGGY